MLGRNRKYLIRGITLLNGITDQFGDFAAAQLPHHISSMMFHGSGTDIQEGADLPAGLAFGYMPQNLLLPFGVRIFRHMGAFFPIFPQEQVF